MPESGTNFSKNIFIKQDILLHRRGLKTSPDENSGALSVGCKRSIGLAGVVCCLSALGKNAVPGSISLSFSWPNQNLDSTVISKRYRDKCFRKAENDLNPILPKGFGRPPSANHGFKLEHHCCPR